MVRVNLKWQARERYRHLAWERASAGQAAPAAPPLLAHRPEGLRRSQNDAAIDAPPGARTAEGTADSPSLPWPRQQRRTDPLTFELCSTDFYNPDRPHGALGGLRLSLAVRLLETRRRAWQVGTTWVRRRCGHLSPSDEVCGDAAERSDPIGRSCGAVPLLRELESLDVCAGVVG